MLVAVGLLLAPWTLAQEDVLKDPDLQEALKQAEDLQKEAGPSKPAKLSDLKKQADGIESEQKEDERNEKAALQKQLKAPGPLALPAWTPVTPQFAPAGPLAKRIDYDHVSIVQTGTSPLTPQELGDAWEAAVADKPINHVRNTISSNNAPTVILFLTTRTDPREEVRMKASRDAGGKITEVEISTPLPKPEAESE